jgi:hypothetical protein
VHAILETDEFGEWFEGLTSAEQNSVAQVIEVLKVKWVLLPVPYAKALDSKKYALRELRVSGGSSPLRVIYAFDPNRDAVLLLGGDKGADKNFYLRGIPKAERLWEQHLSSLKK